MRERKKKLLTGRAVHLQIKGWGPVGSLFAGHRLPVSN